MKTRIYLLILVMSGSVIPRFLSAQSIGTYGRSLTTGITYNSIISYGTAVSSWRNTTVGAYYDDNRSYPVPIGFDFWYDGKRYTQFSVSTNGFMDFDTSSWNGGSGSVQQYYPYGPYSQDFVSSTRSSSSGGVGTVTALAPFYYDLTTFATSSPLGSSIQYYLSGASPNRVLTVEWFNMSTWTNQSDTINVQVKLYEGSGVIEFYYGTMSGTISTTYGFGYVVGINGPVLSSTPTAEQLLCLQTANTSTFSNTAQYMLTTMQTSNSKYTFIPRTPGTPTNLTFSSVTQTAMTLGWTAASSQRLGYAIYGSSDGTTFNYMTQVDSNTTSYTATGLYAGTTYYWKVYAVTEGALSSALQGSCSTSSAAADTSVTSGNWSSSSTWSSGVPNSSTNVVIADGHTVTLNTSAVVNSLQVGINSSGILKIGNSTTPDTLTVIANLTVESGAQMIPNTAYATTNHLLSIGGNILNYGTIDLAPSTTSRMNALFTKSGTQTISGNGTLTRFNKMVLSMGTSTDNILDIFATNFTDTTAGFLTINYGTFRVSTGASVTPYTSGASLPLNGCLWVNNSSAVVTAADSLTVVGTLRVTNGTFNVGNTANENLISKGGKFIFEGGATNIAGRFTTSDTFAVATVTMSGGTMTMPTVGSTSTFEAPFMMYVRGSSFTQSGGTIVIQREGGTGTQHLGYLNIGATTSNVSGGTLQIGNASTPAGNIMKVKSVPSLYNLTVYSVGSASVDTNLTILGDVVNNDTLYGNARTLTLAGDWTNNGKFVPGTSTIVFNGSGSQSVLRSAGTELFKNMTLNSTGTVTLKGPLTIDSIATLTAGTLSVDTCTLTFNNSVTASSGTLTSASTGTVQYNQPSAGQNVLAGTYGNLLFNNYAKTLASSGSISVAGLLSPGTATGHTVTGSTVNFNGTGAQTIGRFDFNNLTLSGSGTQEITRIDTVKGTLTVAAAAVATLDSMIIAKNAVVNNGSLIGNGRVSLTGGTAVHAISGTGTYRRFQMNDSYGAKLSNNVTISDSLVLLNGIISSSTGADSVILTLNQVRRVSGHVNTWLKKPITSGSNVNITFEVGDASNYTPLTLWLTTVTAGGYLCVRDSAGEYPNFAGSYLDESNKVNRYWQMIPSGGFARTAASTDSIRLTYVAADQDVAGSYSYYRINTYNGTTWDSTLATTTTTTSVDAKNLPSLGVFVIGVRKDLTNAYRSYQSGAWTTAGNWQVYSSGSWITATTAPSSSSGTITVQSGHTIYTTGTLAIDQTTVEAGAILVDSSGALTIANGSGVDLIVNGTFRVTSTTDMTVTGTIAFNDGAVYVHNRNGGTIPAATWDAASECCIKGITSTALTGGYNQSFGNFTWNCASQTVTQSFASSLTTINGNLKVIATNTGSIQFANTAATIAINGSLIMQGGTLLLNYATSALTATFNVAKELNMSGGTLTLAGGTGSFVLMNVADSVIVTGGTLNLSATTTADSLRVAGHLKLSGGTITESSTGSGHIVCNGTSIQNFTGGATMTNTVNWYVNYGATLMLLDTNAVRGTGTFTVRTGGTLGIGSPYGVTSSGATGNVQTTTRTLSTVGNYIYNGTSAQVTGSGLPATVTDLTITNSSGVTLTSGTTVSDSLKLVSGNFAIGTNTLTLSNVAAISGGSLTSSSTGTVSYSKTSAGQPVIRATYGNLTFNNYSKTLASGDTLHIAGTFTPGTAYGHTVSGTTVDFSSSGYQKIPWFSYYNLLLSGGGKKTLAANDTVRNNFSIASSTTFNDTLYTLVVNNNIANNGTHTGSGEMKLTGSSSAPTLSGSGTFNNIELDNLAYGAALSGSVTIGGAMILTNGLIVTGADTLVIGSSGSLTRTTSGGYINGFLKKSVPTGTSPQAFTLEVGDANEYAPIGLTFKTVTTAGTIVGKTVGTEHPYVKQSGLDQSKDVNRYWILSNNGIVFSTVDGTFNFTTSDIDASANTANFFARRFFNSQWYASTTNVRTSTSTKAVGLTDVGQIATGELSSIFYWTGAAGTKSWKAPRNWNVLSLPTNSNPVVLSGADSIDVDTVGYASKLVMSNDTLVLRVLSGSVLRTSDSLNMSKGILDIQSDRFDSITTMNITGGLVKYSGNGTYQFIAPCSYTKLTLSGSGIKSATGALTVTDTLRILTPVTFKDSTFTVTVKSHIINTGAHTGSGEILLSSGSSVHSLSGGGSYTNLEMSDTYGAAVSGTKTVINGTLKFTSGLLTVPSSTDTLEISSTGGISRTNGYVIGNLQLYVAAGTSNCLYTIGTSSKYLPVRLQFAGVGTGGYVAVIRSSGEHPSISNSTNQIDSTKDINRWWRFVNNGVVLSGTYSATFAFDSTTEADAGTSPSGGSFGGQIWNNSVWSTLAAGLKTADSTRLDGISNFGDVTLGTLLAALVTSTTSGVWNSTATWTGGRIPGVNDTAQIVSGTTVTLNAAPTIVKLIISSGGTFYDSTNTITITGNFVLNGTVTGSGKISMTTSNDTISGTGTTTGKSVLEIAGGSKSISSSANLTLKNISILAGDTLNNYGVVTADTITGAASTSILNNCSGATLTVNGPLLGTGTLNTSSCPNIVIYNGTISQTINPVTYCTLKMNNGGVKTAASSFSVNNDMYLNYGSNMTVASGVQIKVLGKAYSAGALTNNGQVLISN